MRYGRYEIREIAVVRANVEAEMLGGSEDLATRAASFTVYSN